MVPSKVGHYKGSSRSAPAGCAAFLLLRVAQAQVDARQQGFQSGRLLFIRQITERILSQYPNSPAANGARRMQENVDKRVGRRGGG